MEEFTRTYSVIHLAAINKNIEEAKKRVGNDTKIMAIVKANAYGHGSVEVSAAIKDKVYGFAVATVREALTLRENGIDNPILVLGYVCKAEYEAVIRNRIIFALLSEEMAKDISECATRIGIDAICHIKINTGMNRIGFLAAEESVDIIEKITELKGLDCEGIFMHFATSDCSDKAFSKEQFRRFSYILDELLKRNVTFRIRHCANSAAIVDMPEYKLDMVREGIILYGLRPSREVDANMKYYPALELKTHVIFVKDLAEGEGISYGRTFITDRPMKIATVAIGYADGYPRSLSNKGYVLIHGKRAPIVGRICMDQMMVDVTEIEDVKVEDIVTVIGRDGNEEIFIDDLGELADKFNYEFVCGISARVERKYIQF